MGFPKRAPTRKSAAYLADPPSADVQAVIEAIEDGRAEGVLAATERLADFSASGDR